MIGWVDWEEKETKGKQQGGGEHRASEGVHTYIGRTSTLPWGPIQGTHHIQPARIEIEAISFSQSRFRGFL